MSTALNEFFISYSIKSLHTCLNSKAFPAFIHKSCRPGVPRRDTLDSRVGVNTYGTVHIEADCGDRVPYCVCVFSHAKLPASRSALLPAVTDDSDCYLFYLFEL